MRSLQGLQGNLRQLFDHGSGSEVGCNWPISFGNSEARQLQKSRGSGGKESIIFYNWPSMDDDDHDGTFIAWLYTMAKEVIS